MIPLLNLITRTYLISWIGTEINKAKGEDREISSFIYQTQLTVDKEEEILKAKTNILNKEAENGESLKENEILIRTFSKNSQSNKLETLNGLLDLLAKLNR